MRPVKTSRPGHSWFSRSLTGGASVRTRHSRAHSLLDALRTIRLSSFALRRVPRLHDLHADHSSRALSFGNYTLPKPGSEHALAGGPDPRLASRTWCVPGLRTSSCTPSGVLRLTAVALALLAAA